LSFGCIIGIGGGSVGIVVCSIWDLENGVYWQCDSDTEPDTDTEDSEGSEESE